jgi:anti-sigma regulatory factor (Ser/Thr protein kinase)
VGGRWAGYRYKNGDLPWGVAPDGAGDTIGDATLSLHHGDDTEDRGGDVAGSCGTPAFRHDILFYDTVTELADVAAPFLLEGLAAGDGAVIAVSPEASELLRDRVGNHPLVLERHAPYRTRTPTAITTFRGLGARASPGRRVRVVGEVDFGTTAADWHEWQRYEAVINSAFVASPLWGLCVMSTKLPEPLLTTARHTHAHVRTAAGRAANPDFVDPATYLATLPVPDGPLERTPPALSADDVTDSVALRRTVRTQLGAVDGPPDLIEDFLLAADEMLSNAFRHGRRPVGLRLWTAPGELVCTISDAGAGPTDPFAGYGPAHGEDLSAGGMGLWLARQLCDHVAIRSDEHGSSVRLTTHWT